MSDTEIIHISWVDVHEQADSTGRVWRFEVDRAYGMPWPVRKDGEPVARYPSERSRFWEAYAAWSAANPAKAEGALGKIMDQGTQGIQVP